MINSLLKILFINLEQIHTNSSLFFNLLDNKKIWFDFNKDTKLKIEFDGFKILDIEKPETAKLKLVSRILLFKSDVTIFFFLNC